MQGNVLIEQMREALNKTDFTSYYVKDIKPLERTAVIDYVTNGELYTASIAMSSDGNLDQDLLRSSAVKDHAIEDIINNINTNHNKILSYKSDKRRKNIVKNYEKQYKRWNLDSSFNTIEEYNTRKKELNDILNAQEDVLKSLI